MENSIYKPDDDATKNESIVNLRKRKLLRIHNSDGSFTEFVQADSISAPDGNGNWIETDLACNYFDDQGNPLPEDLKGVAMSHTGRFVPPGRLAVCSSQFHPIGLSRNIYVDVDGYINNGNPICSICARRQLVFSIIMISLGASLIIGLIKGMGLF
jgi:hypothetical protein